MSAAPVRVLVVGAGPAGLAAAARLVERGSGRCTVRLVTDGHHFGGKAASWRDAEGRLIDHGQHVIFGWYLEMKAMLQKAGIDVEAHLVSNEGHTFSYEPRDGQVHDLALTRNPIAMLASGIGYTGLTASEIGNVSSFILSNLRVFLGLQDIEQFDDICFTAWCLANGLAPSIVRTSAFGMSRTAQLNWPGEVSAYSMLASVVRVGRDYRTSTYGFCDGGMSERFWDPLVAHLAKRGLEVEVFKKLMRLNLDGARVSSATFAQPDSAGHDLPSHPPGAPPFAGSIPTKPDSEVVDREFDEVIVTVPATAFQELNAGDEAFWRRPELANVRQLRGVRPLSAQLWHRAPLTKRYLSVINGLAGPLGYVIDNKPIIGEYRLNPRFGSVLYFVGQETSFEAWSDEDMLEQCLANIAKLPGFEPIDRAGILHWRVIRHHSPGSLYFYTEPGVNRFRPHTRTSIDNLWLAGDWVRSEIDFPCMEAAVRSGLAAADAILERCC